jgi:hypothetical protein
MLRNSGCIKLLWDARRAAQDRELSLREADRPQQRFRYGFGEGMQSQPYSTSDGVAASTKQFLEDSNSETNLVQEFIQHTAMELGIDPIPEIHLHTDPEWSDQQSQFWTLRSRFTHIKCQHAQPPHHGCVAHCGT